MAVSITPTTDNSSAPIECEPHAGFRADFRVGLALVAG